MWVLLLTIGFVLAFVLCVAFILSVIFGAFSKLFERYPVEEEDEHYID